MASAGEMSKQVAFESEQMDLDDKFEELKAPLFKGKKLDDPIKSPLVLILLPEPGGLEAYTDIRINGSCCPLFSR
jgi:hypothetical protein